MICFRYVIVNTLHKGDNKYNDDDDDNNNNNNNIKKRFMLKNMKIPADTNVTHKEAKEKLKLQSLCIERKRMWRVNCMIMLVISVATGTATKI